MIYKRKKWYWMDDTVNEVRYREPLHTKNWQEAKRAEKERLLEIAQGKVGARGPAAKQTFNAAVDAYIEERQLHSAEKSCRTDRERSQPLRQAFGELPIKKVTGRAILDYQKSRLATVSGRTINLEVGLLRRVLKKNRQWARLADDVRMLPEQPKEARVLSPEEKTRLLDTARSKPDWQIAYCAAVLALNTTCRSCELRGLHWNAVDWAGTAITIRRTTTKTNAGARVIPLNADALVALMELRDRAERLGSGAADHFVFPKCEHGHFDATRPMKNWRTAWRKLTCKAGLDGLRFHDLRHQAVTELAEQGVPEQTLMAIAGHVSRRMLDHYSHARLAAKRQALDGLTSQTTSQNEIPTSTASVSDSSEMGPTGLEPMTSCV